MATGMIGRVRCQHRWTKAQYRPYPSTPALVQDDDQREYPDLQIEWAACKRCGGARMRLYVSKHTCSPWSYAASLTELLLGRPLDEIELRHTQQAIILN